MNKIGYIVSTLENSGPVNIMYNIIKYLDKKEFNNIYIYTLSEEKINSRKKEFEDLGCIVKKINITNKDIILGNINQIENILEEDGIQVLHSHCLRSNIVLEKIKLKLKKICTIHANIREDYKFKFGKLKGRILEKIYLKTLKNIDEKICCSESVYKDMKKLTKENLKYITNGVDLEKFKIEKSKEESRKLLKINQEEQIFISVGSLCDRKDALFIAKNIEKLELSNYKMIFLGEGNQKIKIENLKNSNIVLTGKVSNVKEYLNAANFYISASNSEGMPNSVLEAAAFKLPLILSNIESHLEIYECNRLCGEVFDKNIDSDFLDKMKLILDVDYKKASEASYKIVTEKLNAVNMSQLYAKYYI